MRSEETPRPYAAHRSGNPNVSQVLSPRFLIKPQADAATTVQRPEQAARRAR
jgi:hypothetical protein